MDVPKCCAFAIDENSQKYYFNFIDGVSTQASTDKLEAFINKNLPEWSHSDEVINQLPDKLSWQLGYKKTFQDWIRSFPEDLRKHEMGEGLAMRRDLYLSNLYESLIRQKEHIEQFIRSRQQT